MKQEGKKPSMVVLTGAGISAESGIRTFRDSGGLWEDHDIMEVASPQGWEKNPELVTEFYNRRREQLAVVEPNAGHIALRELESVFDTCIITQNVDDLHERAGSTRIVHLHGELTKMRSSLYPHEVYEVGYRRIGYGERCPKGGILRPHIVWFGEEVPEMETAVRITEKAAVMLIIGTSLQVYPAAGLVHYLPPGSPVFLVDPGGSGIQGIPRLTVIRESAAKAVPSLVKQLLESYR